MIITYKQKKSIQERLIHKTRFNNRINYKWYPVRGSNPCILP